MRQLLLVALAAIAILLPGCSKESHIQPANSTTNTVAGTAHKPDEGGDDDDPPVIIEMVRSEYNLPIADAKLLFVSEGDTIVGSTSVVGGFAGELTRYGVWQLYISHQDYLDASRQVYITQPLTERVDTLIAK